MQVVRAVLLQHAIQTVLGLVWMEDDATIAKREHYKDHLGEMANIAPWVADATLFILGRRTGEDLLWTHGEAMVAWVYWWGVPVAQLLLSL